MALLIWHVRGACGRARCLALPGCAATPTFRSVARRCSGGDAVLSEIDKLGEAVRALDRLVVACEHEASSRDIGASVLTIRTALDGLAGQSGGAGAQPATVGGPETDFRALFHATYDAIFLIDPDRGLILEANEPACRLVGYTHEEIRTLTIGDLHPYELPRFLEFAAEVGRRGRWQSHELTCRAKWGELIPAELSATAIQHDGRPRLLVLAHDLREHRLAKLGFAVSKIGHDLRNILATAQILSDRVAESPDPDVQRIAPRLVQAVDRAIQLCTQTLTQGRVGVQAPRLAPCQLHPLVQDVAATAGAGGAGWRNEIPRDFVVQADPDQLFRALLNLVRNAAQAIESAGRGEIIVSAAQSGELVSIDVTDTGPGLPAAARERLFEPFGSVARAEGTGLGLLIARELARAHGGDVVLVRSDTAGTTFRLVLPG